MRLAMGSAVKVLAMALTLGFLGLSLPSCASGDKQEGDEMAAMDEGGEEGADKKKDKKKGKKDKKGGDKKKKKK